MPGMKKIYIRSFKGKLVRVERLNALTRWILKSISPIPNSFMTNINPALMQKIFYIPQRQREPHAHHDGQANDLRGGFKVAKGILIFHPRRVVASIQHEKLFSSDKSIMTHLGCLYPDKRRWKMSVLAHTAFRNQSYEKLDKPFPELRRDDVDDRDRDNDDDDHCGRPVVLERAEGFIKDEADSAGANDAQNGGRTHQRLEPV